MEFYSGGNNYVRFLIKRASIPTRIIAGYDPTI